MRVFVTGGTGFIGSAVVQELLAHGHSVVALARSERSAERLQSAGAEPARGALDDLSALQAAAEGSDALIHTAFDNASPLAMRRAAGVERAALHAVADVFRGSARPIVAAGGFAPVRATGPVLVETDPASPRGGALGRNVERTITALAERGVNASVVRLPIVHGDGDHFTMRRYIDIARRRGCSAYVGAGTNLLPAVHCRDAARVFRLAAERADAGARYHAVAEEGIEFRSIAAAIGEGQRLPVVSVGRLRAWQHFGLYAAYAAQDAPASSELTRAELGWAPVGTGLLEDLVGPAYAADRGRRNTGSAGVESDGTSA